MQSRIVAAIYDSTSLNTKPSASRLTPLKAVFYLLHLQPFRPLYDDSLQKSSQILIHEDAKSLLTFFRFKSVGPMFLMRRRGSSMASDNPHFQMVEKGLKHASNEIRREYGESNVQRGSHKVNRISTFGFDVIHRNNHPTDLKRWPSISCRQNKYFD